MSSSSVVFVGNGFSRQVFNEHELFPEPLSKDYMALGEFGHFPYGSNTYRFSVQPDRIVLNHNSDALLSDQLVHAAEQVADALQAQSQGHGVTGLGFNFEHVLSATDGGMTGKEFCAGFLNANRVEHAIGTPFHDAQCHIVVVSGGVRYTLRIEPHVASSGANLFFSVNGHQDLASTDHLPSKLGEAAGAREYIQSVFDSLSRDFEGGEG